MNIPQIRLRVIDYVFEEKGQMVHRILGKKPSDLEKAINIAIFL